MKHTLKSVPALAAALITFGALVGRADAALTITNWNFTPTSLSFDISGTIDGPVPSSGLKWIFLVDEGGNTNWSPAFTLDISASINSNISVNGGAGIDNFWVETGDPSEDRLTMNRNSGWNIGDTLSGTLNVSWVPLGSLSATPDLEFRWGRNGNNAFAGTLQGTGAVPEPSSFLLGLGALPLMARRKRTA